MADAYLDQVALQLHCDGSDTSTTFPDVSWYEHAVTANGNAQVDTAQSKFGGAALLLDNSGDYLEVQDHEAFDLSGDFTIEFHFRTSDITQTGQLLSQEGASAGDRSWYISLASEELNFVASANGTTSTVNEFFGAPFGGGLVDDTWHHIAITRAGDTWRLFFDGDMKYEGTNAFTLHNSSGPVRIGRSAGGTNAPNCWIDEVRITNGTARYTASFTPPAAAYEDPLDANFADVVLLVKADGDDEGTTFVDQSSYERTLTRSGAVTDTARSKFGGSAARLSATSHYVAAVDAAELSLGSGDWTVEFFVNMNDVTQNGYLIGQSDGIGGSDIAWFIDTTGGDGTIRVYATSGGSSGTVILNESFTTTLTDDTWHHVAISRSGGTVYGYLDGVEEINAAISGTVFNSTSDLMLGGDNVGQAAPNTDTWLDEVRVTVGTARYTAAFDPPASPFYGANLFGPAPQDNDGSASLEALTGTGDNTSSVVIRGTPSFEPLTAAGENEPYQASSGAGVFLPLTAEGFEAPHDAPELEVLTGSGLAVAGSMGDGYAVLRALRATGVSTAEGLASGSPRLAPLTASGVAQVGYTIVGAPTLRTLRAEGTALNGGAAEGSAELKALVAEGLSIQEAIASGAAVLPMLVAAGVSEAAIVAETGTWVVNTRTGAVTRYLGYPANSFAVYNGRCLAASSTGLFDTAGGDEVVDWTLRTGATDDKRAGLKRLTEVLMGLRYAKPIDVGVWTDGGTKHEYRLQDIRPNKLHQVRVHPGKGLRSRYYKVELKGKGRLELDSMQLTMPDTTRRVG